MEARDKPILTILEMIRRMMLRRIQVKKSWTNENVK